MRSLLAVSVLLLGPFAAYAQPPQAPPVVLAQAPTIMDICNCTDPGNCACGAGCQCPACHATAVLGEQLGNGWLSNQQVYPGWMWNERTGEWREIAAMVQPPSQIVVRQAVVCTS